MPPKRCCKATYGCQTGEFLQSICLCTAVCGASSSCCVYVLHSSIVRSALVMPSSAISSSACFNVRWRPALVKVCEPLLRCCPVPDSDGLFDNLNEVEISSTVTQMLGQGASCSTMVQALVKLAFEASVDRKRDTPYARDASEAFNAVYSGGKRDDITVLVAHCK